MMTGGGISSLNAGQGMMGRSDLMNNNSNNSGQIDGRELRSGTMMPPKVNVM